MFHDDADDVGFLDLLRRVLDRYSWLLYAYCLLVNHYHLVVETPLANISLGMRQLNGLYARRFNLRTGSEGHVFQARFRSVLVENDEYLMEVCRYVVLNPVRAGVCEHPGQWRWSSFNATVGKGGSPVPLALDRFLDGVGDALADRVRGERLGSLGFLRDDFGFDEPIPEVPRDQWLPEPPSLEEIFASEKWPIATAYRRYGYTLRQIGDFLGCHYATISRALRREEVALPECKT